MPWKQHVLVVANQTADSEELLNALVERSQRTPTVIHLIVPSSPVGGGRKTATDMRDRAVARFRDVGLEVEGTVGAVDPFAAVMDAWDPRRHDEIVVSTLPIGVSKWLHAGLPQRIERSTGAVVTHVVSQPQRADIETHPPPVHAHHGVLTPLSALGWGPSRRT